MAHPNITSFSVAFAVILLTFYLCAFLIFALEVCELPCKQLRRIRRLKVIVILLTL